MNHRMRVREPFHLGRGALLSVGVPLVETSVRLSVTVEAIGSIVSGREIYLLLFLGQAVYEIQLVYTTTSINPAVVIPRSYIKILSEFLDLAIVERLIETSRLKRLFRAISERPIYLASKRLRPCT